jgi:phosphoglucomutase
METGETVPTGMPNSNVLYYELENDAWLAVRPSGTEPKIKFYYGIKGDSYEGAQKLSADFGDKIMDLIYEILEK